MHAKLRGVTIIEVLAAVAIFSIAILTLFGTFSVSLRLTQHSKNITAATNAGQEIIENLRLGGYDNVALNATPLAVSVPELPGGFSKTYVAYYEANDKIKEVTVAVYWTGRAESQAITFVTLIGQGGISG